MGAFPGEAMALKWPSPLSCAVILLLLELKGSNLDASLGTGEALFVIIDCNGQRLVLVTKMIKEGEFLNLNLFLAVGPGGR